MPLFGKKKQEPETLTFEAYHGTSWENAKDIALNGFRPSADGRLGAGVYVAAKDKATRFAANSRHGGEDGVLIKSVVTVKNPKFLKGGDAATSDYKSHDAVRTNFTTSSPNPEWVIRDAVNVKPVEMTRVKTAKSTETKWHKCKTPGCQYQINDNPAYRNVKASVNWGYCCEACRIGHPCGHGGWCQRITGK